MRGSKAFSLLTFLKNGGEDKGSSAHFAPNRMLLWDALANLAKKLTICHVASEMGAIKSSVIPSLPIAMNTGLSKKSTRTSL